MDPRDALKAQPQALQPVLQTSRPNEDVVLFEGAASITAGESRVELDCDVRVAWLPVPEVRFAGTSSLEWGSDLRGETEIEVDGWIPPTRCYVTAVSHSTDSDAVVSGMLAAAAVVGDPEEPVAALDFVLTNFHHYVGMPVRAPEPDLSSWAGRRTFCMGHWTVTLDAIQGWASLRKQLQSQGGYAVSHAGRLERTDGEQFAPCEADIVIDALHFWLGFMRGFWVGPIMPVAFHTTGGIPWRRISVPILTSSRGVSSWYPNFATPELDGASSRFLTLWEDPGWCAPLRHAMWWYVEANTASTSESGLIMAHAALELLGWVVLVESAGAVSSGGFERLPASDKLRLLMGHLRVPLEVPGTCADLRRYADGFNEPDGPGVISRMRNAIMHPSPKKRTQMAAAGRMARHEARQLAIRTLELCLLSFLGFNGVFLDRMARGDLSDAEGLVPWMIDGGTP